MSGTTVVHLDARLHNQLKEHCRKHDIRMKDFVTQLVEEGIGSRRERVLDEEIETALVEEATSTAPTPVRRKVPTVYRTSPQEDPWSAQPFWDK